MINVKISYTCLVVSHHWIQHRISSSTDYGTHLANLRNDSMSYTTGLLRSNYSSLGASIASGSTLAAYDFHQLMWCWRSTCDRRWYAVKHLPTKISDDNCWGNLLVCCLPEYRLMVCSEHVKEQIFVRRRKRLREWWFAFLLCVDRVSDGIRTGALWLAIQCGKERLTRFQQVFERSRRLSNYRVQFWKISFSEFAECGELSFVEGIRHGITTCDGVHSKKLET